MVFRQLWSRILGVSRHERCPSSSADSLTSLSSSSSSLLSTTTTTTTKSFLFQNNKKKNNSSFLPLSHFKNNSLSSSSIVTKKPTQLDKQDEALVAAGSAAIEQTLNYAKEESLESIVEEACCDLTTTKWACMMAKLSFYSGERRFLHRASFNSVTIGHARKSFNFNKKSFVESSSNNHLFKKVTSFQC